MAKGKSKIVILTSECGESIDLVLLFDNYDDNCNKVIGKAMERWNAATDLDFRDTIFDALRENGYLFSMVDDFVVINDG